ncbi:MAG: sec-independent protein translocase protein TatC [Sphingobacteriales bacterium]|jgi:sec-independent protein translocase protein TatC
MAETKEVSGRTDGSADVEMSFLEHLEALRWHLLRSVIVLLIATGFAFYFKHFIFDVVILGPKNPNFITYQLLCKLVAHFSLPQSICVQKISFELLNTQMAGQFTKHFFISFMAGLIITFPYLVWEIWRFLKPALYNVEKSTTRGIVFTVTILFSIGLSFGYFIVCPMSINFLANYTLSEQIQNQIAISSYISTVATISFVSGLLFQLPLVIYILARFGIVTAALMKKFRRHAILVILIAAAILTPTPDIATQLLIGFPLFILYEISIFIAARVQKKKLKRAKKQAQ